jgi:hypothetical protein
VENIQYTLSEETRYVLRFAGRDGLLGTADDDVVTDDVMTMGSCQEPGKAGKVSDDPPRG